MGQKLELEFYGKLGLSLIIFLTSFNLQAQSLDPLLSRYSNSIQVSYDSLSNFKIARADSLIYNFQLRADILQSSYRNQAQKIQSMQESLQLKQDSLTALQLPTDVVQLKLDSLNNLQSDYLQSFTKRFDALKAEVNDKLNAVTLPSPLQESLDQLKGSIQSYSLPALSLDDQLPDMAIPKVESLKLPTLTEKLKLDPNLKDFTVQLDDLKKITGQAGTYAQDIKNIAKGNLEEVKSLNHALENKLSEVEGMDQLTKGQGLISQAQGMDSAWVQSKAKALVEEQVTNLAQDHFAGKQELLQQSMDKLGKLKLRYSEVQSMADLPKRLPNPLKDKPLIERLVPGIGFQIQKSENFLLDVNPTLVYIICPRIHAGIGWNQRLPWDGWDLKTDEVVYGPRVILEVKWIKGINFRLLPEILNTTIPPKIASSMGVDPAYREWVPSLFVGIKKDFTVYKTIQGFTEVLYNLYDQDGKSPYNDRLSVRFGFEFPMKKRKITTK